jgi:outer membrane protein assembly factor BamB
MIVEMPTGANGATEKQILYAGGDAVIGVQPNDGKILWRYQYEKQGLTNAVTPLVIEPGKILLGGQGVQGCLLLDVRREQSEFRTEVVWENSKVQPFYCTWVQTRTKPNCILGFAGKTLTAIEATTGKVLWQKRGWTDANIISTPDALVIVRGDGVAAIGDVDETGIRIRKANAGTQDRVWAAPVIVDGMMYLAGRNSLSCVPIEEFAETDSIPDGSAVTSMDAMYGNKPESIQKLIDQSKDATQFTKMEYQETVSNSVVQLGESDYGAILENLEKQSAWPLAIEIATDWSERNPQSIVAFERLVGLLRRVGQIDQAESLVQARMVDVTIIARIPKSATAPEHIYLSGNAAALGPWQAEGVELTKIGVDMVQVKLQLPKGDFQYKFTCGTWDNVESRADGRSISNRRIRIAGPMTIQAEIQAWKDSARESK